MKKSEKAAAAFQHLMKKMSLETGREYMMAGMVMEYIEQTGKEPETKSAVVDEITSNFQSSLELLEDERNSLEQKFSRASDEIKGLKEALETSRKKNKSLKEKLDRKVEEEFNGTFSSEDVEIEEFEVE
jgi:predicted RNase H-like nuclease (RuvC/YqgF family)